jgi:hypothetical protein
VPPRGVTETYDRRVAVAQLFQKKHLDNLSKHILAELKAGSTFAIDGIIGFYARDRNLRQYQLVPRPFQHIEVITNQPHSKWHTRGTVHWTES